MSLAANASVESSANGSAPGLITVAVAHVSPAAGETALDPLVEAMPAGFVNPITKKTISKITDARNGHARRGFKVIVEIRFDIMQRYSVQRNLSDTRHTTESTGGETS